MTTESQSYPPVLPPEYRVTVGRAPFKSLEDMRAFARAALNGEPAPGGKA